MGVDGTFNRSDVDPHQVAQLLAALRGNREQLRRVTLDLEKMRERKVWNERDWAYVYAAHRQLDRLHELIKGSVEALRLAGVDVTIK